MSGLRWEVSETPARADSWALHREIGPRSAALAYAGALDLDCEVEGELVVWVREVGDEGGGERVTLREVWAASGAWSWFEVAEDEEVPARGAENSC